MAEKVTIIIPVYNVEKYLARCIDSVIKQSFNHLEIVMIDDGSTDKSGKICDEYAKIDNRITVIHKKNAGLAAARNTGLDYSTGKYVCFLDSDDYIEKDAIHILYNEMEDGALDLCAFGARRVDENGNKLYEIFNDEMFLNMEFSNDDIRDDYLIKSFLHYRSGWEVCFRLFKREIIEKHDIRFNEEVRYAEDIPFTFEYMLYVKKWAKLPYVLYDYTYRLESITGKVDYKKMVNGLMHQDFELMKKSLIKKDCYRYDDERVKEFYDNMLAYFMPKFLEGMDEEELKRII